MFIFLSHLQVSARQSEGSRRRKQGLSLPLPASGVVQQIGSASQIQILNSQCQARGDQSDGVTASLSLRAGQGLGLQEVHPPRFPSRRSQRSLTRGQINHFLWGEWAQRFCNICLSLSLSHSSTFAFVFFSSCLRGDLLVMLRHQLKSNALKWETFDDSTICRWFKWANEREIPHAWLNHICRFWWYWKREMWRNDPTMPLVRFHNNWNIKKSLLLNIFSFLPSNSNLPSSSMNAICASLEPCRSVWWLIVWIYQGRATSSNLKCQNVSCRRTWEICLTTKSSATWRFRSAVENFRRTKLF